MRDRAKLHVLVAARRRRTRFERDFRFAALVAQVHLAVGGSAAGLAHDGFCCSARLRCPAETCPRRGSVKQVRFFGLSTVTRPRWGGGGRPTQRQFQVPEFGARSAKIGDLNWVQTEVGRQAGSPLDVEIEIVVPRGL